MAENTKKPAIRFAGFTEAWEQRKLGEVADIVGGGTPSTSISEFWDGDIDWYAPAEIADQIYLTSSQRKITEQGYNHSSAKMLPAGTVLFTSRAGIGKTAILSRKGCTNQGFQSIIPHKDKLDSYFVFSRTEELKQYGETVGAGSTFVEVSGKQMANMVLMMPKTMEEQKIIGKYFTNLDNLITLHQRKYDKLTNAKKSMLEKMFPKNGSNVPEIRFKGFTEAWEQCKLGEIFEEYSEKNHEELPALMIIQGGGTIRRDESERSLLYDKANLSNYKMVNEGDFIVHLRSFEGGLERATNIGIISPAYHTFHGENTDSRFYYSYFRSKKFIDIDLKPHVYGIRDGRSIDIEGMKTVKIPFTSYEEQKAIGMFIEHLDNLITLHQRKLEKLKNIKKSMLEKMFI